MPNIKPVSDLRNYNEVLKDISIGDPVFLTKNGRGCFAIVDIEEYEQSKAELQLLADLARGEQSAREQGWVDDKDARKRLGVDGE